MKGQEDEEEDVSRYWVALKKDDTGNWKKKRCGKVTLEEAVDLSQTKLGNELMCCDT